MSENKSNPSSASSTPSTTPVAATNLNPAEFTVEFLRKQTVGRLKEIKKATKIRKKTETPEELVDCLVEWYQKNHGPASAAVSATPKTRKPRAKKTKSDVGTIPNTVGVSTTLEDSIRAEVAQDAAGGETVSETPKTKKGKKPAKLRQTKSKVEKEELKPITLQRPTKRVLATLTDAEKEDIRVNKEAKAKIYQFLDYIHDQLRGSSVAGEAAMDDIIMFIILAKLDVMIYDGSFDIWDTRTISNGGKFDDFCETLHLVEYMKEHKCGLLFMLYTNSTHPLRNTNPDQPDLVRQLGMLLKAHPISRNFVRDINLFHLDNPHTLIRILKMFDTVTPMRVIASQPSTPIATETASTVGAAPGTPAIATATPTSDARTKKPKKQTVSNELQIIDLDALNQMDAIGTIYEYFTNKYKGNQGKDMGQYFTERSLMLMSLHLIDKQDITELGITSDSTMGDEFCGTFGFPLKTREYFKKSYGIEFRPENIYGVEYSTKTFTLAAANAMLSTKSTSNFNLTRGSSFNTNLEPHLDVSVHNVPFGDTMRWSDIAKYAEQHAGHTEILEKEIPVKANVDAVLSAQLVIYKTRKMGILIIKDGKETSSPAFAEFRRTLMDKCCVRKIMKIPGSAFTHTNTKTICIYFTKRDGARTESIQFCELNDKLDTIHEICIVPRADLEARWCSWNPQDYLIDEHAELMKSKSACEWKKLGDITTFKSGKMLSRKDCVEGEYYVIGGGQKPSCNHNSYNMAPNTILCSKSGEYSGFISKYSTPVWASDCFGIIPSDKIVNNYLYYWLKHIQEQIYKKQTGGGQPHVNERDLINMEIPVPSLEIQNETVSILDELSADKDALSSYVSHFDRQMSTTIKNEFRRVPDDIQWKKLGEVVDVQIGGTPKTDITAYYENGTNLWVSVSEMNNNVITDTKKKITKIAIDESNVKLVPRGTIMMSFKLSIGKMAIAGADLYTNEAIAAFTNPKPIINPKFLYYWFMTNPPTNNSYGAIGGGNLNKDSLYRLSIPIPSLAVQQQTVSQLENIESQKEVFRKEIERLETLMKSTLELSYTTKQDNPFSTNLASQEIVSQPQHEGEPANSENPVSSSEEETESETETD